MSLVIAPVRVCPDWNKPSTIRTDVRVSQEGLKATLSQQEGSKEHIISYARHSLTKMLNFNDTHPGDQWKLSVPRAEQKWVLREANDEPTADHLGIVKTLVRSVCQYYWPGMMRTAARHVCTCSRCQKYKTQQQATAGRMHATHVLHLLWKNGTLCFIRSIVHRIVLLAFGTNLGPIMLPIPRLRTLSAFRYVLCLRCQIHRS